MSGKPTSLWDRVVWAYLPQRQQRALDQYVSDRGRAARMFALGRAIRTGSWRRSSAADWAAMLARSSLWIAFVALLIVTPLIPRPRPGPHLPPTMPLLFGVVVLLMVVEGVNTAGRRNEFRAMLLRRRRRQLLSDPEAIVALRNRRAFWWDRLAEHPAMEVRRAYLRVDGVAFACGFVPVFGFLVFPLASYLRGQAFGTVPIWLLPLVMLLGLLISTAATRLRLRAARRRLLLAMDRGLCPDCGYDLRSVLPDSRLGGSLGPRRCLECGSPWPLLPAALPPREGAAESSWIWNQSVSDLLGRLKR